MSLSQSRWNQETDQQKPTPKQPNKTISASTSKYIPPHSRPNPRNPENESSRKSSANIIIADGDRMVSKKFTKPNQTGFSNQEDSKLQAVVNSFKRSTLSTSHLDPMSLVPSPSRGIFTSPRKENQMRNDEKLVKESEDSEYQEQDLKNLDFQLKFFEWIFNKVEEYKSAYPNRINLFLYLSLKDSQKNPGEHSTDHDFKVQIDRISSLVREIRKLREGIFASGRRDSFAVVVYELSAELALESVDFSQLNTLLNHLIMDLYQKVSISEHLIRSESSASIKKAQEKDTENFMNHQRRTKEEVLHRRLMFARVLLLLPIVTRLDLSRFLEQFTQICDFLSEESLRTPNSTDHPTSPDQVVLGISTSHQPKLLELGRFFKLVLRNDYVQLNRRFIKPKLQKILKVHDKNDPITEWDDLLFLIFLNLIRPNLIWRVIQTSYYHLSLEDDRFIFNLLSLEFRHFNQLRLASSTFSGDSVNRLVNAWLLDLNIQRNSKGIIQLK